MENNLFKITNANECFCTFESYQKGHSVFLVSIYDKFSDTEYRLAFEGVEYIDSPIRWKGANFRLGTEDETKSLLRTLSMYTDIPDDYVLSRIRLYISVPQNEAYAHQVKILAVDAGLLD
jgi:hypothetical protein